MLLFLSFSSFQTFFIPSSLVYGLLIFITFIHIFALRICSIDILYSIVIIIRPLLLPYSIPLPFPLPPYIPPIPQQYSRFEGMSIRFHKKENLRFKTACCMLEGQECLYYNVACWKVKNVYITGLLLHFSELR